MKLDLITNNAEIPLNGLYTIYQGENKNDEYYTPRYAIEPILKYLKPNSTIWCPFDTEESLYVKILEENGHTVIPTHINIGLDFFDILNEPDNYDYIISNPPYSLKNKVFARLFELKKPFAMLVGVVGIFESKVRFDIWNNNPFEIMYFDKRVAFFKDFKDQKPSLNPPFSSVYICSGILPKQIVFEKINK